MPGPPELGKADVKQYLHQHDGVRGSSNVAKLPLDVMQTVLRAYFHSVCAQGTLPFPPLPLPLSSCPFPLAASRQAFALAHLVDQSLCAVLVSGDSQVCIALSTGGVPLQGVQEGQIGGGPSLQLVLLSLKLLQHQFAALPTVVTMQPI